MSFQLGNTFVFGEQPAASKFDQLWRNDDALADGSGVSYALSSWTPSWAASGSMTIGTIALTFARKFVMGDFAFISLSASFTLGGSASNTVQITNAPETAANANEVLTSVNVRTSLTDGGFASINGTTISIRKNDSSNWATGSGKVATVKGWYEK